MTSNHTFPDGTDPTVLREALRFAEKYLDAQLAIIGALAQRAGALAGMFGAGSLAMLAVELSFFTALRGELNIGIYSMALIAPAIMFGGCALCGMAAGTSSFQPAGNSPDGWTGNVRAEDLNDALIGELSNYGSYIDRNETIITKHARYFKWGLRLGFLSPIVLVLIGAIYIGTMPKVAAGNF